jgi:DNA-binding transcriptional MerR regulator
MNLRCSDDFALYDVTPVENLFLLEYLPHATGDQARVYLYGLMQCRQKVDCTVEGLARALRMKPEKVLEALRYWETRGLLKGVSDKPPCFEFLNVRAAMQAGCDQDPAYRYRDFNRALVDLAQGPVRPAQFAQAMEWVEELELPADVLLLMARRTAARLTEKNGGKPRSVPYLFKVLGETAADWAERDIRTIEKAEAELARALPEYKAASAVIDYFGFRRAPTTAEIELCGKWLGEWGFSTNDIQRALRETASSGAPSFAYLDGILKRHRGEAGRLDAGMDEGQALLAGLREALSELGAQARTIPKSHMDAYRAWIGSGLEPGVIVRAAQRAAKRGRHAFDSLEEEVRRFEGMGIRTVEAADAYNIQREALRHNTRQMLEATGRDRRPSESDMRQMAQWLQMQPMEVVLLAARRAREMQMPMRAIEKNLKTWTKMGIRDLKAAQAELDGRKGAHAKGPALAARAATYSQRKYDEGFLNKLVVDLDAGEDRA